MTDDKRAEDGGRLFFKSEIFKDGPGAGNLSNTIGAEQGIEFFGGETRRQKRARPARTYLEPAREIPAFAETDVLVVGGGAAGAAAASCTPRSAKTCS